MMSAPDWRRRRRAGREVVSSTDVVSPWARRAWPRCCRRVADFGQGLSISAEEIRIFLALRERPTPAVRARAVLRSRLLAAVEDYARGITVDARAARRDAADRPSNPDALREALSDASMFSRRTRRSRRRLARLETLCPGRGLGRHGRGRGSRDRCRRRALARPSAAAGPLAAPPNARSRPWSGWNCGRGGCARRRDLAGLTDVRGSEGRDALWATRT